MESGRLYNKKVTAIGNGLSNTGVNSSAAATPLKASVSTGSRNPHYSGETESPTTLTGVGDGIPAVGAAQKAEKFGYVSASGSKIELDDTPGAETISLTHHSGASVTIDPDGAIHITSSSRKGIGIAAPFGDAYVSASGDVVVKGSMLSLETSGDLNINVGGTFSVVADAVKISTNTLDENIDGTATRSVTNDSNLIVGGLSRQTIAGDERVQVSGEKIQDTGGNFTQRVGGNSDVNIKGTSKIASTGEMTTSTAASHKILADSSTEISSGSDMNLKSGGANKISSGGASTIASGGAMIVNGSSVDVSSGGAVKLSGGSVHATPAIDRADWSSMATTASVLGAVSEPPAQGGATASPEGPSGSVGVSAAETMPANDIVDELTSVRKYPNYPNNAKRESADAGSVQTVEHDKTDQAEEVYNEYSSKNAGNANPASQEDYGSVPDVSSGERSNDIQGVDPGISVPANHNSGSKISRYFTLGDLTNANSSHKIPPGSYESVVANHIYVAYNVLDPIKEKFPNIVITSAYRKNSKNHITGLAIDLVVESRNMADHAEIARFARDNLPVDQVFIERNDSGKTHVHVRGTKSKGVKPKVMTCGDKKCRSHTDGINLEYLKKVGAR